MDQSTRNRRVSQVDEFELISAITAGLPTSEAVAVGLGDDAALLVCDASGVLACSDMMIEGRHFRRAWSSPEDIGHRAAAANQADIAAMGGRAVALLVSLAVPPDLESGWVADLIDGIQAEADKVGAVIVGGDTCGIEAGNGAPGPIVISVTALGRLGEAPAVRRNGAQDGDQLALVGRQGWAAAGLTVLSRGFRSPRVLVDALRRPEVPYDAGPAAALAGATAMIDVSDGLLADVGHIALASGVAIDLDSELLPVDAPLRDTAVAFTIDPLGWVLTGGEDHSLAATFPADAQLPDGFVRIGSVSFGEPGVTVDGAVRRGPKGWVHFGA
ncbi:MAG: thiamine-phosphate kinase [Candidatus Nanopelagicales bacterium]